MNNLVGTRNWIPKIESRCLWEAAVTEEMTATTTQIGPRIAPLLWRRWWPFPRCGLPLANLTGEATITAAGAEHQFSGRSWW